ncbi:hypothetical protein [Bacillus pseudomycoides]|uniref:hypothetical protein n=1 Tax=Bacillus pseudomycoides TaxID=64104 RepID=UPI000BF40BD6|nr:hypothetical protein [Bacillus pseudomycoides]PEP84922.1 hypothetical protein CN584_13670 [Bacillus pseudomycoides]
MRKKINPVTIPPILTYAHHAHQLAILMSKDKYLSWFYSGYIQLYSYQDNYEYKIDYYSYNGKYPRFPEINDNWLKREFFQRTHGNIVQFLVDIIDEGFYSEIILDQYFIPGKRLFQIQSKPHQELIYGYDKDKKVFYALGFNKEDFGMYEITFENLEKGFYNASWSGVGFFDCTTHIDYSNNNLEFNFPLVKQYIKDYAESRNSFMHFNPKESLFGLNTYNYYIQLLADNPKYFNKKDIRPLHIFAEHKHTMVDRLRFMQESGFINNIDKLVEQYIFIERKITNCKYILLRYRINEDEKSISKIIESLNDVKELEEKILYTLLNIIK